jgi:hypothetical protein
MPMRQRKEIQKLLRTALIFAFVAGSTGAGTAIYAHISPSLPLSEHWFDYVDEFPIMELGVAVEFPGPAAFRWRIEGCYSEFPEAGLLESGMATSISAGIIMHKNLGDHIDVSFGPQVTLGWIAAKGTYEWAEGDSVGYHIDFDGNSSGMGIGIVGGVSFYVGNVVRLGIQPAVTYYGASSDDVPIVGRNVLNPDEPDDYGIYRYEGEYIALSIRLIAGLEF